MDNPVTLQLRQQQPFRYADTVEALDARARCAVIRLRLEPGRNTFDFQRAHALPGVLLLEGMAQACGVLLRQVSTGQDAGLLVGVEQARVPDEISYPAQVSIHVQLVAAASAIFVFDAFATVFHDSPLTRQAQARIQIRSDRQLP